MIETEVWGFEVAGIIGAQACVDSFLDLRRDMVRIDTVKCCQSVRCKPTVAPWHSSSLQLARSSFARPSARA